MQGIPLLNIDLAVQAVGFQERPQGILGVLITPWFVNLILLPSGDAPLKGLPIGAGQEIELPARKIRFTVNELDGIGPYLSHSLFSPVNCFHDQSAAVAAAQAALAELMTEAEQVPLSEEEQAIEEYFRKETLFAPGETGTSAASGQTPSPLPAAEDSAPRLMSRRQALFGAFLES